MSRDGAKDRTASSRFVAIKPDSCDQVTSTRRNATHRTRRRCLRTVVIRPTNYTTVTIPHRRTAVNVKLRPKFSATRHLKPHREQRGHPANTTNVTQLLHTPFQKLPDRGCGSGNLKNSSWTKSPPNPAWLVRRPHSPSFSKMSPKSAHNLLRSTTNNPELTNAPFT